MEIIEPTYQKPSQDYAPNELLNYTKISSELIKSLRKDQSQRDLSQALGYSFNQVGKWESTVTRPKWNDFILICKKLNIPIEKYFRNFFWNFTGSLDSHTTILEIEKSFFSISSNDSPQAKLLRSWTKGRSQPDLEEVLMVLDSKPGVLIGFLSQFVDVEEVPSLTEKIVGFKMRMDAVMENPLYVFINAALQVKEYQDLNVHDERILAEHATCSVAELRLALLKMKELEILHFDGKKYVPCSFDFSFSSSSNPKLRSLTKYATHLAASRYSLTPAQVRPGLTYNPSVSSVRVVALSEDAAQKARELVLRFHNEMADIVSQDQLPKKNAQVILIHSFASNINSPAVDLPE